MKHGAFFGRESELRALRARLDRGERLVSVVGIGGAGKTRLVSELAREWPAESTFIDLTEVTTRAELLDVLRAADVGSPRKRGLVILDNFEQLVDEAGLLAEIVERHGGVRFVVTSREVLRLSRESVLALGPLDESAALLVDRIRARVADWEPTPTERRAIDAIADALDGIPLAVELAAERAAILGVSAVAASLGEDALTVVGPRDYPLRHRTMHRAIEGTWSTLGADAQRVLLACAVFRGGFEVSDVLAVHPDGSRVVDALQRLSEKSLLAFGKASRLHILAVIRDFVLAEADKNERAELEARHELHFLERLEAAPDDHAWISSEWDNLAAALGHALSRRPMRVDAACRLLLGIGETALRSGRLERLGERCDLVLACEEIAAADRARLLALRSRAEMRWGRVEVSAADLEEAIRHAIASGDAVLHAHLLRKQTLRLARAAKLDEALAMFEEARKLDDPARKGPGSADDVLGLSSALRQRGQVERARVVVENYLRNPVSAGDRGLALHELALANLESGRLSSALEAASSARDTFREIGWRAEEARALLFIGIAKLMGEGSRAAVEEVLSESILCAADAGDNSAGAYARGYLGVTMFEQGDLEGASKSLSAATPFDGGHVALFASYRAAIEAQRGHLLEAKAIAEDTIRDDIPPTLDPAVRLNQVHIHLAEARVSGDEAAYERAAALVAETTTMHGDALLALRIARRALAAHRSPTTRAEEVLTVEERGTWFAFGGGDRVDCTNRANVQAALAVLAKARLDAPGRALDWRTLVGRIWGDETIAESAARNRLRVTIAMLRKSGLRSHVVSDSDGYRISEWVPLRLVTE